MRLTQGDRPMLQPEQVEELICLVAAMDRAALTRQFSDFRGSFPLDFTPDFLQFTDVDRLRHIFVAICLQCQQMPATLEVAAAA
jgi:hypothetical protein